MHAHASRGSGGISLCLLSALFCCGTHSASAAPHSIALAALNSGGGYSSSAYSSQSSIGEFAGGHLSGSGHTMLVNVFSIRDGDADGSVDSIDNCASIANPDQLNNDSDQSGDVCDPDDDNDGLTDIAEAGLGTNPFLADTDGDGLGDAVDPEPLTPNPSGDLAPYGNPDGKINVADLLIMQWIVLDIVSPIQADIERGDIYPPGSGDGVLNLLDLMLLEQMVLNPSN